MNSEPWIARSYCVGEALSYYTSATHLIFSFHSNEEGADWVDGEGWLGSLIQLRSDLMNGDHRCLYLGWLLAVLDRELDDDSLEPPVPPGLGSFNTPLESLADFLRIDPDLITAAAEKSEKESARRLSAEDISGWVAKARSKDKDAVLIRLLEREDSRIVASELRRQALSEIRAGVKAGSGPQTSGPRTVGALMARGEMIEEQRQKQEAESRARDRAERQRAEAEERKKHLESLDGKESALWTEVDKLIRAKQAKPYNKSVSLLKDLRDLADMTGNRSEFARRMSALHREHARKGTLVDRFRKADLLD